jgi:hypothetical protein
MTRRLLITAIAVWTLMSPGSQLSRPSGATWNTVFAQAPAPQSASATGSTTWYFYRVKWGYQDEFLDLFQRNHYPVLKAQLGTRLLAVRTYVPRYHGDGRADWTFAVAITAKEPSEQTGPTEAEISRKLYPNQETFRKEEKRRFELLDAHWDVPLNEIDMATRVPTER